MAKFLLKVSYTQGGVQGLIKDGGTKRRDAVAKLIKGLGGKVETFYFAFGNSDAVVIVHLPDASTMAAVSMAVAATGAVKISTVPLITPEEIDKATKKNVPYQAPGK